MDKEIQNKILNFESGVSLIITFFIMLILLAVVMSIVTLLFSEIKVIRNIGNSSAAFYAADSGIEKVLFYDEQVLPTLPDGTTARRGLCTMYPFNPESIPLNCPTDPSDISGADSSIFCIPDFVSFPQNPEPLFSGNVAPDHNGCDPSICDDCLVSFSTTFDNRTYYTTAKVEPSSDGKSSNFEIQSRGTFGGTERKIETMVATAKNQGPIEIQDACAEPVSSAQGDGVSISARVSIASPGQADFIAAATASIYYYSGANAVYVNSHIPLELDASTGNHSDGTWSAIWNSGSNLPKDYHVDITATDTTAGPNTQSCINLWPHSYGECLRVCSQ